VAIQAPATSSIFAVISLTAPCELQQITAHQNTPTNAASAIVGTRKRILPQVFVSLQGD
jgi:hypothetical protein